MKKLLTIITTVLFLSASAQIDAHIRVGMKTKPASPVLATGIDFKAHGFGITPELIIDVAQDQPANFGMKVFYEKYISEKVSIRGGGGYFYQLYTTDKYDAYKNGFTGNAFVAAQYDKWFGMAEYMGSMRLYIGVRSTIFNVQ